MSANTPAERTAIAAAIVKISEKRAYQIHAGERTIAGLTLLDTWRGFSEYSNSTGSLIVLDAEQRIITGTPALLRQLGIGGEPQIGDAFEGGIYAGKTTVNGKDAHLILLPGEAAAVDWDGANTWAQAQGGRLPTRAEQRTLIVNLKSEFKPELYWSGEQHAVCPSYAWFQVFYYGSQSYYLKSAELRSRAVRSVVIQ